MKQTIRLCLFQFGRITLLAIAFAAILPGRSAFGGNILPLHTLDITENSSTSLTVLFDLTNVTSSVVSLNSPDNWTLTFNPSIQFGVFNNFWTEPDNSNFVNGVFNNGPNSSNVLSVISDNPATGGQMPDGTPQQQNIVVNGQQGFVSITFHDLGDAAVSNGVPENASTLALFFLSLAALLGASRLRSGRLA
ncbi:MAG: hypothetical protein ACJ8M1_02655 [Chthoniobacterales bacterium]